MLSNQTESCEMEVGGGIEQWAFTRQKVSSQARRNRRQRKVCRQQILTKLKNWRCRKFTRRVSYLWIALPSCSDLSLQVCRNKVCPDSGIWSSLVHRLKFLMFLRTLYFISHLRDPAAHIGAIYFPMGRVTQVFGSGVYSQVRSQTWTQWQLGKLAAVVLA